MKEKNPYENGVDIPDFVESRDNNIDKSIFKLDDEEEKDIYEDEEECDDEEDSSSRKLSNKGIQVLGITIVVVLVIVAGASFFYGMGQANKYKALKTEYDKIQTELAAAKEEIITLQNEITIMQNQASSSNNTSTSDTGKAYVTVSAINVRSSAGGSTFAKWDDIPSSLRDVITYDTNSGAVVLKASSEVTVYETKTVDSNTWGRLVADKDVWVCLVLDGSNLANAK